MVESAIYVLVGFLTATLLALLSAPALARRAARLAAARARLLSPLSETQARAERDALRGQHAVEIVRIEQRLRAMEDQHASSLAELGRRTTRVVRLEEISSEREAEIAALRSDVRDLGAQLGAHEIGLRDMTFLRDDARNDLAEARARVVELETLVDESRAAIATLETRATSLDLKLADARRSAAAAERAAETEHARLSAAMTERMIALVGVREDLDSARALAAGLRVELEGRIAEAAGLRARLVESEPRLAQSEAAREDLALESARQLKRIGERDAALERAEATHRAEALRLTESLEISLARENALRSEIQALTTSRATAEGALSAERAERADLRRKIEDLRARLAESVAAAQTVAKGDLALRQSIARLGREIARDPGAVAGDEPAAAQIVTFTRREPAAPASHAADDTHLQERPIASER